MMPADNHTVFDPVTYILSGIPGTVESHVWIAIPFCLMYVSTLLENSLLLFIIVTEQCLHEPMYLFVSMLATDDLLLSTTIVPKMLAVFWFRAEEISFVGCLTQMFFIHVIIITESAILLAMIFDWYCAICDPLRYTILLTNSVIRKMGLAIVTRSFCFIFPLVFLVKPLNFCKTNLLPHNYHGYMSIACLASDDITVIVWYGAAFALFEISLDAVLIAVFYGLILRAVFQMPSKHAQMKAFRTCGSHIGVILMFYTPPIFSNFAHCFGHIIPGYSLILLASLYMLIPPMLNPIIYGITTKVILKQVSNVFYPCNNIRSLLS